MRLEDLRRGATYLHRPTGVRVRFLAPHLDDGAYLGCLGPMDEEGEAKVVWCDAAALEPVEGGEAAAERNRYKEAVAWVARLAWLLGKKDPGNQGAANAKEWLRKEGLLSPLRDEVGP